jgi:serine/arginine repetitive matrix protein 2
LSQVKNKTEDAIAKASKEPNRGIVDHERKRKLEAMCMELQEVLQVKT